MRALYSKSLPRPPLPHCSINPLPPFATLERRPRRFLFPCFLFVPRRFPSPLLSFLSLRRASTPSQIASHTNLTSAYVQKQINEIVELDAGLMQIASLRAIDRAIESGE